MRPGRLDRILYVGPPDLDARKDILRIRTSHMAVDPTLDINILAELVCPVDCRPFVYDFLQLIMSD